MITTEEVSGTVVGEMDLTVLLEGALMDLMGRVMATRVRALERTSHPISLTISSSRLVLEVIVSMEEEGVESSSMERDHLEITVGRVRDTVGEEKDRRIHLSLCSLVCQGS